MPVWLNASEPNCSSVPIELIEFEVPTPRLVNRAVEPVKHLSDGRLRVPCRERHREQRLAVRACSPPTGVVGRSSREILHPAGGSCVQRAKSCIERKILRSAGEPRLDCEDGHYTRTDRAVHDETAARVPRLPGGRQSQGSREDAELVQEENVLFRDASWDLPLRRGGDG